MHRLLNAAALLLMLPGALTAQHAHNPYAGYVGREIKALDDEEISGLLAGEGLGTALAAELNGYPGPRHVLDLAAELELSPEQRERTERIFAAMDERAKMLGAEIVELERELDGLFAGGTIDEEELARLVTEIGRLRADLRLTHLAAHLEMSALLTDGQRARYSELRGYTHPGHQGGR